MRFSDKDKNQPVREIEGRSYRSVVQLEDGMGRKISLLVEHSAIPSVPGAPKDHAERQKRYPNSGSSAVVKSAWVLDESGKPVTQLALKCFRKQSAQERAIAWNRDNSFEMARQEIQVWQLLGDEADVLVRHAGDDERQKTYILMPWIDADNLGRLCFTPAPAFVETSARERFELVLQLLSQLQGFYLKHGLLVSDLKPENILYSLKSKKVTQVDVNLVQENKDIMTWTTNYLEKEKQQRAALGGRIKLDWSDSMYAFGLIVLCLLQKTPYDNTSDQQIGVIVGQMIYQIFCSNIRNSRPRAAAGDLSDILENQAKDPKVRLILQFWKQESPAEHIVAALETVQSAEEKRKAALAALEAAKTPEQKAKEAEEAEDARRLQEARDMGSW